MASNPNAQSLVPSQNNATSTAQQNASATAPPPSTTTANIHRPAMAPPQPIAIEHNAPNTRGSRELRLFIALRHERVELLDTNPFVDSVIGQLQQAFEEQCQVDHAGTAIIDEEQLARRKIECVKAGLYALRSILTAWLKYPAVGGRLEGAPIGVVDFMYTARSAPVEQPAGQLAAQYARIMANTVDPPQDDFESAPHAQLRVNNCFLAIKKQFMALFVLLDEYTLTDYLFDKDILSEDEAAPKTYRLSAIAALHPPSIAAHLTSAKGLMEAAEDEEDDNQHVFFNDGVLKTKGEKHADLAVQVAKAKKAEMEQAAQKKVRGSASKATVPAQVKSKARKSNVSPVESEENEEEEDGQAETPVKKAAVKKAVASKIKGGKKAVPSKEIEQGDEDDATPAKSLVEKSTANKRKRSAPVANPEDADANADDTTSKPAPKKRAKSTPAAKKTNSDKSSGKSPTDNIPDMTGSVAPNIAKRGGAAPKWLRDEDDFVKQIIVDHPDWPMPKIYQDYSAWVANTPYQRYGQVLVDYRADFVEFPKGIIVGDKERRKYDIAWRTYESVRQHTEKFKSNVSNFNTSPPYTWEPAQANLVAGQPKRPPPPRPAFFNNPARTPVPPATGTTAHPASSISTVRTSATATGASAGTRRSSGWSAINHQAPVVDSTSAEVDEEAAVPAGQSAEGDVDVESIEDFVAQQSASPSSAEGDAQVSTLGESVAQQSAPSSSAGDEQGGDEEMYE